MVALGTFGPLSGLIELNGHLVYSALSGPHVSDGTTDGTFRLIPMKPPSGQWQVTRVGNVAYLLGKQAAYELWVTDGTLAGTALVAELCDCPDDPPMLLGSAGDDLLLTLDGTQILAGSRSGVRPFLEFEEGYGAVEPGEIGVAGATLVFAGDSPDLGRELFGLSATLVAVSSAPALPADNFELGAPYPNPATDLVTIPITGASREPWTLSIYDILGRQKAKFQSLSSELGTIEVPTGSLAGGVYLIRAQGGERVVSGSFTIVR